MGQKIVYISNELVVDALAQGSEHKYRCIEGIPEDAVLVGASLVPAYYYLVPPMLALTFSHPSWPEPQQLMPRFEAIQEEC